MNWIERIEQNPEVLRGKPIIRGTRISVELILERLGAGWTYEELLEAFPHLQREDIQAACAFAANSLS